ncbi:hypothetical protein [Palleronia rufa]|uniref:hypothetical protein n=1 Tax=Palleronia rufa TaxID=1530186 RepID=UPI00056A2881|nr:hypothetical protein [Palleronia rufa]
MSEFEPGEVVEIRTEAGLRYAVVTHRHPSYPVVVCLIAGARDARPGDLSEVAGGEAAVTAMIPLRGVLEKLGLDHEVAGRVDPAEEDFPTFKMPIRDKQGEIVYWWFWDGQGLTYEVDPSTERDALPLREVMSAARFKEKLDESV